VPVTFTLPPLTARLPVSVGAAAVKFNEPAFTAKALARLLELNATVPDPVEENSPDPAPCSAELIVKREPAPTLALIPGWNVTDPPEIVAPPMDVIWEEPPKMKAFEEPINTFEALIASDPENVAPSVVNPSEPPLTVMLLAVEEAPSVNVPALVLVKDPPVRVEPIAKSDPEATSTVVPALFRLRLPPEIEPPPVEEIWELTPKVRLPVVILTAPPFTARLPESMVDPSVKETTPAVSVMLFAMAAPLRASVPAPVLVMVPPVRTFEIESVTPEPMSTEFPAVEKESEPAPVIPPLAELVIPEVDAKVSVVPESTSTVPPLTARLPDKVLLAANSKEPALTVVVPEYKLTAPKTSVPTPDLVTAFVTVPP